MLKLGSHVGMSGKEMFLGSVKEAVSYGANTFMIYTGAPQNTRRKPVEELRIEEGLALMEENGIEEFVVHAPYIINLANTVKPETFELAVDFLRLEIERTEAMHCHTLILHPGAHVGAGVDAGIAQIVKGLNEVLEKDGSVHIALETMAGKGTEIGRSFEELARIYDGVKNNHRLRVCFDTCHTNDAGYDVKNDFAGVMEEFDRIIGIASLTQLDWEARRCRLDHVLLEPRWRGVQLGRRAVSELCRVAEEGTPGGVRREMARKTPCAMRGDLDKEANLTSSNLECGDGDDCGGSIVSDGFMLFRFNYLKDRGFF